MPTCSDVAVVGAGPAGCVTALAFAQQGARVVLIECQAAGARKLAGELGLEPRLRLVKVADQEAAQQMRFLGSPTVRVGGRDVDPSTEDRTDYGLSCRVFRTEAGIAGQPDERWVREALLREAGGG